MMVMKEGDMATSPFPSCCVSNDNTGGDNSLCSVAQASDGRQDGALYSTCVWPITFKQPARRERGAGGCPCFLAILVPSHWEHVGSVGLTGTLGGVGPLSIRITARLTLSHVSSRYRLVRVREPHGGGGGRPRSILLLQTDLEGNPLTRGLV